jgi:hypothetical protein
VPGVEPCPVDAAVQSADDLLVENTRLEIQLDGLHRALRSRAAIEQAKGVLMAFCRCSEADAFTLLTRLSQQRNVRVRALADALLELAGTGFQMPPADAADAELKAWLRDEVVTLTEHGWRPERARQPRPRPPGPSGG